MTPHQEGVMREPFEPSGCETAVSQDGNNVLIRFLADSDEVREVIIPRTQIPALVAQLHSRIPAGQVVPISPSGLRSGETIRMLSHQSMRNPDGTLTFLHTFEILEQQRVVQLPVTLDRRAAAEMIRTLVDFLAGDP